MATVGLALPLDQEEHLGSTAARHGHRVVARCSGAEETRVMLRSQAPELLVVHLSEQYFTPEILDEADALGTRVVGVSSTDAEHSRARRLGISTTVSEPPDWTSILGAVDVGALDDELTMESSDGKVVAVWGPPGAPGRTTLAIAVAAELAALEQARVALVDADAHAASVAPMLGILDEAPGFAAACRLAGGGALTAEELDRLAHTVRCASGELAILTGIGQASRWPELSQERVDETFRVLREWAAVSVVDTASSIEHDEEITSEWGAPRRNAATTAALTAADHLVLVGSADPVGLARLLRAHVELLELDGVPPCTVVVNRVRTSAIGLNPAAQIRQTLERLGAIHDPVLIPFDLVAADRAQLQGRPLGDVAPKSPARRAVRDLVAERLLPALRRG